jgi:hypothetical protein
MEITSGFDTMKRKTCKLGLYIGEIYIEDTFEEIVHEILMTLTQDCDTSPDESCDTGKRILGLFRVKCYGALVPLRMSDAIKMQLIK